MLAAVKPFRLYVYIVEAGLIFELSPLRLNLRANRGWNTTDSCHIEQIYSYYLCLTREQDVAGNRFSF